MKILKVVFCLFLSFNVSAQNNIYSLLTVPATFNPVPGVHEFKDNLYILSFYEKDSVFSTKYTWLKPMRYSLHKFNVNTHNLVASTVVFGDTTNADSIVIHNPRFEVEGDRIHLAYVKRIVHDTVSLPTYKQHWWALYYTQLDTNLNVVVPEKLLKLGDYSGKLGGLALQHLNVSNRVTISFYQGDSAFISGKTSKYIQLDLAGNKLMEDSLGNPDVTPQNPHHEVAEIIEYPGNRYLVSGRNLYNFPGSLQMFYLADSAMKMIDTFAIKPFNVFNSPDVSGYYPSFPELVALPSGSIIGGTNYYHEPALQTHTGIIKCPPNNRFTINKLATFKNIDASDNGHTTGVSFHNLVYNNHDNSIYYASVTHKDFSLNCLVNENFVEVLCLDTNLAVKWKKYIRVAPDMCAVIGYLEVCHNKPGVIVSGSSVNTTDPQNSLLQINFIYRLDSAIVADVSDNKKTSIRNRIAVYPNPADDYIQVDDVFKSNCTAYLYDIRGQLLKSQKLNRASNKLLISDCPKGSYLLRVITDDGELVSFKILKE